MSPSSSLVTLKVFFKKAVVASGVHFSLLQSNITFSLLKFEFSPFATQLKSKFLFIEFTTVFFCIFIQDRHLSISFMD